jgi:hypothetical protein
MSVSRVRENRTHGLTGGRWRGNQPDQRPTLLRDAPLRTLEARLRILPPDGRRQCVSVVQKTGQRALPNCLQNGRVRDA